MAQKTKICKVCGGKILAGKRKVYCCAECARLGASMLYYKNKMDELTKRISKRHTR